MSRRFQALACPKLHCIGDVHPTVRSDQKRIQYSIVSFIGVASIHELFDCTCSPPTSSWNLSLAGRKRDITVV